MSNEAFICDAVRTPIGRYGGALSGVRADDLAAVIGSMMSCSAVPIRRERTIATAGRLNVCNFHDRTSSSREPIWISPN